MFRKELQMERQWKVDVLFAFFLFLEVHPFWLMMYIGKKSAENASATVLDVPAGTAASVTYHRHPRRHLPPLSQ